MAARLEREPAIADVDDGRRQAAASRQKTQPHPAKGEPRVTAAIPAKECPLLPTFIEAIVGDGDQLRPGASVDGDGGDPVVEIHRQARSDRTGVRRDAAPNSLGDPDRGEKVGAWQQQNKLVAPPATGDVSWPQRFTDGFGRVHQRAISGRMAEAVVDRFEVLQIEHRNGDRIP